MTSVREVNMCPPCASKIQEEILKFQKNFTKSEQTEKTTPEKYFHEATKHSESKRTEETWSSPYGKVVAATPKEVKDCLSSLNYVIPICESCKHTKNISIIQLSPEACRIERPQDQKKSAK